VYNFNQFLAYRRCLLPVIVHSGKRKVKSPGKNDVWKKVISRLER